MNDFLAIAGFAGRICLGLVFATAALQKMRHWRVLEGVIDNYRLLPERLVRPMAALLPPTELIIAIALLAGILPVASAMAAILLLLGFATAMAANIHRGRSYIDCGCHQSFLRQTLKPALIARNFVLATLLAPSFLGVMPMPVPALATGLAAGFAFFLLYLTANSLAAMPNLDRLPSDLGAS